jgi:hypothetical protein
LMRRQSNKATDSWAIVWFDACDACDETEIRLHRGAAPSRLPAVPRPTGPHRMGGLGHGLGTIAPAKAARATSGPAGWQAKPSRWR